MSDRDGPEAVGEINILERRTSHLLRNNESLRHEAQRLLEANAELTQNLVAAEMDSRSDRAARQAALNLMEDAIQARQAEQRENVERRRVESELREANRRKDEFLATLAHELRNPLAPIRNSVHILRMAGIGSDTADRVHEMLERQINHLVRLVDDLMELSRISRGKVQLRKEAVDVAAVVAAAVEISQPLIESARHELVLDVPPEPLTLFADSVRIAQVVANLLNNAAKFTDAGGRIVLTVRREQSDVLISVRDNGAGIPADMISKLFNPFTQIDHTLKRSLGGLGIGLSFVRSLVEAHGGSVAARSEGPGHGSEFVVRLPLATEEHDPCAERSAEIGSEGIAHRRILIVDDNRDAAESLGVLLKCLGGEIWTANDGRTALEVFQTFRPSVVVLDIGMPGMDGIEVARRLRELPGGLDVTLVALSGWAQEEDIRRSMTVGFDHHLVKPLDVCALQAFLAAHPPNLQNAGPGNNGH